MLSRRLLISLVSILVVSGLGACATYGDWVGDMEQQIAHDQPNKALEILAKRRQPARDAVLNLLNKAMLLRMDGQFANSNADLESAKHLIDKLTITSISEQTGALAINDTLRSYVGDPYEQVLLHVYAALNYLEMGELDNARVEALQLDVKLNQLTDDGFDEDAFARYLTGMIYEALREWDDAMIAYRKAYEAYQGYPQSLAMAVPDFLRQDLLRLTQRLGLTAELERYQQQFGWDANELDGIQEHNGELIFLLHSGLAPLKREVVTAAFTESGQAVTIAMPYYLPRRSTIVTAQLHVDGATVATELGENINTLAIASLEKQKPAILARAIARAVLKSKAVRETRKNDEALGFFINIVGVVSERADTRSWSTLPNRIYFARLPLPPGQYDLTADLLGRSGDILQRREYNDIEIKTGEKRFLSLHKVVFDDLAVPEPYLSRRHRH